ncbi:MAG: hypothetical protein HXY22_02975 [Alphaproteobacteria bacterium]|nr:hypothetical protein [Alphaproteobacteria bacterium]
MWDFSIGRAFGVLASTWPFIVLRLLVYFGITLAYVLVTGTGAGIGYGAGWAANDPEAYTIWGGIIGFGLVSGVLYWFREYLLYLVKAGHIAVMVEALDGRPIPEGRSQIDYAQRMVRERFVQANILFALDQIIKGVLRVITGTIFAIGMVLPIPYLEAVLRLINTIITLSLTYVDELILAYNFRVRSDNPFESSRHAIVLYAQNYGAFLKNAVWLMIFMWVLTAIVFIVAIGPAFAIVYVFPGQMTGFGVVVAVLIAWSVKAAVIEPFAIACLMQAYFKKIEGQVPDPTWDARLAGVSDKFREFGARAASWVRGAPAAPPAAG